MTTTAQLAAAVEVLRAKRLTKIADFLADAEAGAGVDAAAGADAGAGADDAPRAAGAFREAYGSVDPG